MLCVSHLEAERMQVQVSSVLGTEMKYKNRQRSGDLQEESKKYGTHKNGNGGEDHKPE